MTAADQHREFGACVESDGAHVLLQVGKELVALTPHQAQRFAFHLARAYAHAGKLHRGRANFTIGARG